MTDKLVKGSKDNFMESLKKNKLYKNLFIKLDGGKAPWNKGKTGFPPSRFEEFLELLVLNNGWVSHAVKQMNPPVTINTYNWAKQFNPELLQVVDYIKELSRIGRLDDLESIQYTSAMVQGRDGVSDRIFALKALHPRRYRESVKQTAQNINIVIPGIPIKDRAKIIDGMKKNMKVKSDYEIKKDGSG